MHESRTQPTLYIVDSEKQVSAEHAPGVAHQDRKRAQLELFSSEPTNLVILQKPERHSFAELLATIRDRRVRHVVDLRDLPFLTFDDLTRQQVFERFLAEQVDYVNVQNVAAATVNAPTGELLRLVSIGRQPDAAEALRKALEPLVNSGPMLALTDGVPSEDRTADLFVQALSSLGITASVLIAPTRN